MPAALALPAVFLAFVFGLTVGVHAWRDIRMGILTEDFHAIWTSCLIICLNAIMIVASWYNLAYSIASHT